MSIRVHVNGQIVSGNEARISVFDRGFLYGDSVFETLGTVNGTMFALGEHLERLARSASLLGIKSPALETVRSAVLETVASSNNSESRIRIIVSRGEGWGDLDPGSAVEGTLVVLVAPRGGPTVEMYAAGVSAIVVSVMHNHPMSLDPSVKSGNYLSNVLATGEARRAGAHEGIMCTASGGVAEGASSNVFMVKNGRVQTPALEVGILPGITRRHVIRLCRQQQIAVEEMSYLAPDDLRAADEVFITSSVRGVLPVTKLDGNPVGTGVPGPVSRRIMDSYALLAGNGS